MVYLHCGESGAKHSKVGITLLAKVVNGLWRSHSNLMTIGIFAVEKTERILFKSCLAGIAKAVNIALEIINKSLSICRSALLAADRVDMKLNVLKAEAAKNGICKRNCSSV